MVPDRPQQRALAPVALAATGLEELEVVCSLQLTWAAVNVVHSTAKFRADLRSHIGIILWVLKESNWIGSMSCWYEWRPLERSIRSLFDYQIGVPVILASAHIPFAGYVTSLVQLTSNSCNMLVFSSKSLTARTAKAPNNHSPSVLLLGMLTAILK